MLAPGLFVSLDQDLVAGIHEEDLIFISFLLERREHLLHVVEGFVGADIQSQHDFVNVASGSGYKLHKGVDQADREIIHAVITHILQKADRRELSSSAHACDYNKSHFHPFRRPACRRNPRMGV